MNMKTYESYQELLKPTWSPPAWIFGPVWTMLYLVIAVSYGYVFYLFATKKIPFIVALPFVLNLVFNFAFTPIQFGLKNLPLASLDIILVLGTLAWALIAIYPYIRWVSLVNIPYFVWVLFATVLQLTITVMNW
jgi:tryptophan-rich sensory protein